MIIFHQTAFAFKHNQDSSELKLCYDEPSSQIGEMLCLLKTEN